MLVLAFRSCSRLCLVSKLPTHSSIVSHCSAVFCRQQFRVRHPLETKKLAKPSVRLLSFCSACSVCRVGSWWRLIRFVALKNRLDNRSESQYGANKYMCQHFYFLIIIWWWDIAFHLLPEHELHAWMLALMCEFVLPWLNSNPWHHGISSVHHSDNGRSMTTTTTSIQENLLNRRILFCVCLTRISGYPASSAIRSASIDRVWMCSHFGCHSNSMNEITNCFHLLGLIFARRYGRMAYGFALVARNSNYLHGQ